MHKLQNGSAVIDDKATLPLTIEDNAARHC